MTSLTSESTTVSAACLLETFSLSFSSFSLCCSITADSSLSLLSRDSTSPCAFIVYNKTHTCLRTYFSILNYSSSQNIGTPYLAKIVHHLRLGTFVTQTLGDDLFMVCYLEYQKYTLSLWHTGIASETLITATDF